MRATLTRGGGGKGGDGPIMRGMYLESLSLCSQRLSVCQCLAELHPELLRATLKHLTVLRLGAGSQSL